MRRRVLLVDDDRSVLALLQRFLAEQPYLITAASSAEEGFAVIESQRVDVIISDLSLPSMHGMDFLDAISQTHPDTPFIVITGFGTVDTAVAAMKKGAIDYLTKPLNKDQLLVVLEKASRQADLLRELSVLRRRVHGETSGRHGIIGNSKRLRELLALVDRVAPSQTSILIRGESGTGKELLAKAIHHQSPRASKPFLAVNCGAFTETLLESELFGHKKGAFTGAIADHPGVFEAASGGTIFLDEIGDISPAMQVKLLRVLQEREVKPVGATESKKIDIRVVCATHRPIRELVRQNTFREDLYFRIAVVTLELPPLRERPEDIPLLVAHFLERLQDRLPSHVDEPKKMSPDALALLMRYAWPGNVRELENAVEHAMLMAPGNEINQAHLPPEIQSMAAPGLGDVSLSGTLREALGRATTMVEMQAIRQALVECKGNKSEAANRLGISRTALYNKMKRYHLDY